MSPSRFTITAGVCWEAVLAHPGAHLHLYGKREARPGRKMGHVTVCEVEIDQALDVALRIRSDLGIGESGDGATRVERASSP